MKVAVGIALLLAASIGQAQERPAAQAAPDSTRPEVVFSEWFGPGSGPAFVILAGRTAYRLEIEPREAVVTIRAASLHGQEPLVMRPIEDPAAIRNGVSYLLVPDVTREYRIDVQRWVRDSLRLASDLVRIRLVREPRELAFLEGRAGQRPGDVSRRGRLALLFVSALVAVWQLHQ